jgi:hypothetical protein
LRTHSAKAAAVASSQCALAAGYARSFHIPKGGFTRDVWRDIVRGGEESISLPEEFGC